ncbi:MAG: Sua5/YciO/YrdC/YwlC family protein [Clostridia bacterium]|jgi:L-threonylcarbamoyladenylate synthase|nr:Sua5/YciO/YrdC/YwlC family protein [Clostridia bacterium]
MKTVIISNLNDLNIASDMIKNGGLVASPTETVYGLCADALNEVAVSNIFRAKGRPNDNPLIVHIANRAMLDPLVKEVSPKAQLLINAFWPGPLTLIFKASSIVPKIVTGGLETVAIRLPSHPIMQRLISLSNTPLAAPSANTSGKPSPTNASRVIEDLNGKIEAIIDGGNSEFGVESTVLDTTSEVPTILRPGGVTYEMLEKVLGTVHVDPAISHSLSQDLLPKAPGMKYTHYSPNAEVFIVKGTLGDVACKIHSLVQNDKKQGKTVGVLATDETKHLFHADLVLSAGTLDDLSTIAANLFEQLRAFDDSHIDTVYSLAFPKTGIGDAIMNRLEKSAAHHIITV